MTATTKTCKQCRAEMSLQRLDPVCGEQGVLKVTLIQLPAFVCPNQHRHFALRDFPMVLLDRVASEEMMKLAAGEKRGLIFKHYHCGGCGAALAKGEGREETFDSDVTLEGLSPFRVELTVPVYKCPSCGKEQVRSLKEIQELAAPAMAHAFKAADLHME